MLSPIEIGQLIAEGHEDLVRAYYDALTPLETFQPRPNAPEDHDEQQAFIDYSGKFGICLGGTGSGKTIAAAVKTAKYVLNNRPPRERCPFWIVGETFDMVCGICWQEKLSTLIPKDRIWGIDWYKSTRGYPFAVMLKHPDNPKKIGWVLEFKSFSQGRQHMQGASIGGYWINEECPIEIVQEIQGRCRDYNSPGWADFTPIEVVSPEWPEKYDDPDPGWKFFHLNVERNDALADGWAKDYIASFPEEERETRRIGVFASFRGMVFKEFAKHTHVIDKLPTEDGLIPSGWKRIRGIDWGYSNPLACMWVAFDGDGRAYVYDEHYESQKPNAYHVAKINEREWKYGHPDFGQTYADNADPQQMVEFTRMGVQCTGCNKGFGQFPVNARVSLLRKMMMPQGDGRPKLFILSRCKNLIREIRGYHWSQPTGVDDKRKNAPNNPVPFDDHAIDAMGYAIYTHLMGKIAPPEAVRRPWQPKEGVRVDLRRNFR